MKTAIVAAAAAALALWATGAGAATTFEDTGQLQIWSPPADGTYEINVYGAQGGDGAFPGSTGGLGAEIGGEVQLTQNDILIIAVGQQGIQSPDFGGGGGGATFVFAATPAILPGAPLIVAGGGGGAPWSFGPGGPGQTTLDGQAGLANFGGAGGRAVWGHRRRRPTKVAAAALDCLAPEETAPAAVPTHSGMVDMRRIRSRAATQPASMPTRSNH